MPCTNVDHSDQLRSAEIIIKNLQEELEAARKQIECLREKNEELKKLSITDELTGLYNQRHFYSMLEREAADGRKKKHPLCLLFFDVDGLKKYNDTHGHSGGDDVLKAVAQGLSRSIENNIGSGYRYGGDEFAVILPESRAEQAVEIAKGINEGLRKTEFQHVTLSFGIAELGPGMDSKSLFSHADDAMYVAKRCKSIEYNDEEKIHVYGNSTIGYEFLREAENDTGN
jgi:two-component system cell cycle response regulator